MYCLGSYIVATLPLQTYPPQNSPHPDALDSSLNSYAFNESACETSNDDDSSEDHNTDEESNMEMDDPVCRIAGYPEPEIENPNPTSTRSPVKDGPFIYTSLTTTANSSSHISSTTPESPDSRNPITTTNDPTSTPSIPSTTSDRRTPTTTPTTPTSTGLNRCSPTPPYSKTFIRMGQQQVICLLKWQLEWLQEYGFSHDQVFSLSCCCISHGNVYI